MSVKILKDFREKYNVTREEQADLIGVTIDTLNNWEYRKGEIPKSKVTYVKTLLSTYVTDVSKNKNYSEEAINTLKVNEPSEIFKTKAGSVYTENSDGSYTITVPLVPFDAYASYVNVYQDEIALIEDWEKVSFNVDKIGLGKYLGFKSKGDSMNGGNLYDTPDRALILGREIGRQHWLDGFRSSDYGFILITKFNMMHKDIIDFNKEKGTITCHSRNNSPEYTDFDLKLNDVYQIFRVIKRTF